MKLGRIERWCGEQDAALKDLEKATEDALRFAGPDHPYVVSIRMERDYQRAIAGRVDEAERDLVECLDAARKAKGGISLDRALSALGYVESLAGRPRAGEPLLREALGHLVKAKHEIQIARVQSELAECLARQGRKEEARDLLSKVRDTYARLYGTDAWLTRDTARRLATL